MKFLLTISLILFPFLLFLGCDNDNEKNSDDPTLAKITFKNRSSYSIDIFKNFNPEYIESNTKICTVNMGRDADVYLYASSDQFLGDVFYLRFKVHVVDSTQTGTGEPLYFPAERTMSNITLVIESGKQYTEVIENPPVNELRFVNGLIEVHNQLNEQIWIENFSTILPQLCRKTPWLTLGQFGYYELSLPFLAESWPMDNLTSRDTETNRTPFPSFELERGKLYSFDITNTGIIGPRIRPINPLAN